MRPVLMAVLAVACFATARAAETIPVPQQRPSPPAVSGQAPAYRQPGRCEIDLAKTGAAFKAATPAEAGGNLCAIASPVEISMLPGGVLLEPPALLDCPTALMVAEFVESRIQPLATRHLGSRIQHIRQDSAFVCRPRNGTSKLSEHAFGRAIDIASFTTITGLAVPVKAMPKDREVEASFLTAVRAAACGPFATVLGPGSDADHATHFHFDLALRKGSAYCR